MPDQVDEIVHTEDGADRLKPCGCVETLDPDWDTWVIVSMCRECGNMAAKLDYNLPRLLDLELDHYVHEAAGGHRVQRIMPADPTKRR